MSMRTEANVVRSDLSRPAGLVASDLVVGRHGRPVARIGELCLQPGQALLVQGLSGSGKSTLLLTLAGLLPPVEGKVRLEGRAPTPGRGVAIIFQNLHLLEGLSALSNVRLSGLGGRAVSVEAARHLLERCGIGALAERPATSLSRGEAQRVAIARALAASPSLLLADEPTASLDEEAAANTIGLLRDAAAERGAILVITSHDRRLRAEFPDVLDLEVVRA